MQPLSATNDCLDLEAQMALNGSVMSGLTIQRQSAGVSWTALAIYLLQEKGIPLLWSEMSCIFLVGGPRKVRI